MKLKVGDKVRVRAYEDMAREGMVVNREDIYFDKFPVHWRKILWTYICSECSLSHGNAMHFKVNRT